MLDVPPAITKHMLVKLEELPEEVRSAVYILVDKKSGQPLPRVHQSTCTVPDFEGYCRVVKKRKLMRSRLPNGTWKFWWKDIWTTVKAVPTRDNPEKLWPDRRELESDPVVDFQESLEREQRIAELKDSLHKAGKHREAYRVRSMFSEVMEDMGCTTLTEDGWKVCHHHSGFRFVNEVLASDLPDEEKATRIMWFFVRPSKFASARLPGKSKPWTEDKYNLAWTVLQQEIEHLENQGRAPDKAKSMAHARMEECNPGFHDIMGSRKQVQLSDEMVGLLGYQAWLELTRMGVSVYKDDNHALRAYRWLVGEGTLYNFPSRKGWKSEPLAETPFKVLRKECPFVLNVPPGKFPTLIIRKTAVNLRLQDVKHENAWVRYHKADEPAVDFNKRPLRERKHLLGCDKCQSKECWQDDAFSVHKNEKGIYFTINGEILLNHKSERVANIAAQLKALGSPDVTDEEMELFHDTLRSLVPDPREIPDEAGSQEGFKATEEFDERWEQLEQVASWESQSRVNKRRENIAHGLHGEEFFLDFMTMKEQLRAIRLCGLVIRYDEDHPLNARWNRERFFRAERHLREKLRLKQAAQKERERMSSPSSFIRPKAKPLQEGMGRARAVLEISTPLSHHPSPWDEEEKARTQAYLEERQAVQSKRCASLDTKPVHHEDPAVRDLIQRWKALQRRKLYLERKDIPGHKLKVRKSYSSRDIDRAFQFYGV